MSDKWEQREKKLRRRRYGMRIDGRSTKTVLAKVVRQSKK